MSYEEYCRRFEAIKACVASDDTGEIYPDVERVKRANIKMKKFLHSFDFTPALFGQWTTYHDIDEIQRTVSAAVDFQTQLNARLREIDSMVKEQFNKRENQ